MMVAILERKRAEVRVARAILRAWQLGYHEGWKYPIAGRAFDVLVKRRLMEARDADGMPQHKLTGEGLGVLIKVLDALTLANIQLKGRLSDG